MRSTIGAAACQTVCPPAKRGECLRARAGFERLCSTAFAKARHNCHTLDMRAHRYMRQRMASEALEANYHAALAPLLQHGGSAFQQVEHVPGCYFPADFRAGGRILLRRRARWPNSHVSTCRRRRRIVT